MRKVLLGVLIFLSVVAVWQLSSKRDVLQPARLVEAFQEVRGAASTAVAGPAPVQVDPVATPEPDGPPVTDPAPVLSQATEGEMYPFPADTPLLETTVSLPSRKAPLVYFAYCGNSNDEFTSASSYFGEFLKYQIRQQASGELLMNTLPNRKLLLYPSRSYRDNSRQVPYETYLTDALKIGADLLIYPVFDGSPNEPVVSVKFIDLQTSRTETWSSQQAGLRSVKEIILAAATEAFRFAGYSDGQIKENMLEVGAPSDDTFSWYASASEDDLIYENLLKVAQADPEFVYVYSHDAGTTWVGQLLDIGLRKFPGDRRLLARKAISLNDAGSTMAALRYLGELVRQFPDDCYTQYAITNIVVKAYSNGGNAKEVPPVYKAMVEQLGLFAEQYPECYAFKWDYAYALKSLADHIRGTHTIDKIPAHIWPERNRYLSHAFDIMKSLVEKYPDHASLLAASAFYYADVMPLGTRQQIHFIDKVHALDPRDTTVEACFASHNGIGYGSQRNYFSIIDHAIEHHKGDPEAMADIADIVRFELSRQIGWKQMTAEEAYGVSNPWLDRFTSAAEFVYSTGRNLDFENDWVYYLSAEKKGDQQKIKEWRETGQNSYVAGKVANEEYQAQNWEKCARYAKLALLRLPNTDKGEYTRYYLVKSLWKLKRYEESMREARAGIFSFPRKQTFPYMYAVVACEADKNLDAAYECAWRAVDISVDNPGCNETFEKLRKKLSKPAHPALVAIGK